MKTKAASAGFTLVEVMIAMAIVGVTAVVLLNQRMEVVRDAARARDLRTAWVLMSQKLATLELDKTLWTGLGSQANGDFADVDPDYAPYRWDYVIVREPIDIADPMDPQADKRPKEILRLSLAVRAPSVEDPLILEAEFAIADQKAPTSGAAPATGAGTGTTPPSGSPGTPPTPPRPSPPPRRPK